ncbi:hypothetical protein V6N13_063743 [Hibiscus sabdariffa]|uniref:Uncharacterized protein n=1 Tax=Hibiscus sabdariffa TaxID=183260 RepID=A0ABR2R152_9ROSI
MVGVLHEDEEEGDDAVTTGSWSTTSTTQIERIERGIGKEDGKEDRKDGDAFNFDEIQDVVEMDGEEEDE